jgi:hypothetical protein
LRSLAALTLGSVPFVEGKAFIVEFGLALWPAQMLVLSILGKHKWSLHAALYSLTTLFTFGASFSIFLIAFTFHAH